MNDIFSSFYEIFGLARNEFNDSLYNEGVFNSTGIATVLIAGFGMIIFYLLKTQKPLTFNLSVWAITVFVICIINIIIAYVLSYSTLNNIYLQQNKVMPFGFGNFAGFALINFVWSLFYCLIFSVIIQLIFKNIHGNVPFPFRKKHK